MLSIEGIHTYYGPSHVLHGVDISLEGGDVVSVMGRNGAGKTTLMRSIMGLTPPRKGKITFEGLDITALRPHSIFRLGIRLVPQGRRVFPKLTVEENLELALVGQKTNGAFYGFANAYDQFPRLGERRHQKVKGMSGGERQMLAIARALMGQTRILLMDEPTEGLAPLMVKELRDSILQIKTTQAMTILLAEQNVKMALSACDRHYILEKGEIRFEGTTEQISDNKEILLQSLGVAA